jgi:diacylglycerol O-acyltransferase
MTRTWRLNSTDEMLYSSAGALGSARVIQLLWRFPEPVSRGMLEAEWHRLDEGRLSREAVPSRVPGARRKWVSVANAEPLHVSPRPLAEAATADWIDQQVRVPLPGGSGKLWRLAAAPCAGGMLVSLTVPHFRCDGLGLFAAVGTHPGAPSRRPPFAVVRDSDLGDAAAQIGGALRGLGQTLATPAGRRRLAAAAPRATGAATPPVPAAGGSRPRFFTSVIIDVDARSWEERAAANGGTVNSLLLQVAANLVRTKVPRDPRADIEVGIPVSLRESAADERANALVVVPLTVPGGTVRHGDLEPARRATKELLRDTGGHSATLVPEPLWHLLPAGWAGALKAPGAQQTDVVASNFGTVPDTVTHFAGSGAGAVALRTMNVPGLVPGRARLRASLVLLRSGDRMTMTVTGSPDCFGGEASLGRQVSDELAAWGLRGRPWWGQARSDLAEEGFTDVR